MEPEVTFASPTRRGPQIRVGPTCHTTRPAETKDFVRPKAAPALALSGSELAPPVPGQRAAGGAVPARGAEARPHAEAEGLTTNALIVPPARFRVFPGEFLDRGVVS